DALRAVAVTVARPPRFLLASIRHAWERGAPRACRPPRGHPSRQRPVRSGEEPGLHVKSRTRRKSCAVHYASTTSTTSRPSDAASLAGDWPADPLLGVTVEGALVTRRN